MLSMRAHVQDGHDLLLVGVLYVATGATVNLGGEGCHCCCMGGDQIC